MLALPRSVLLISGLVPTRLRPKRHTFRQVLHESRPDLPAESRVVARSRQRRSPRSQRVPRRDSADKASHGYDGQARASASRLPPKEELLLGNRPVDVPTLLSFLRSWLSTCGCAALEKQALLLRKLPGQLPYDQGGHWQLRDD